MTEPLVPPEIDLQSFDYMPLKVAQLRDSDFSGIANDAEFRAGVTLWCAAWHQLPASSLPDDERLLCKLAGFGRDLKAWGKVRDVALRGFVLCSDGRFYHPIIADLAIVAWRQKKRDVERTRNATKARMERNGHRQPNVTSTKGEGDRKGKGEEGSPPVGPPLDDAIVTAVTTAWNNLAAEIKIPAIQHFSDTRKAALRLRLQEIGGLQGFYVLCDKIRASPMLRGQNDRAWTVSFDWILQPRNLTKIMEGNYDERARPNTAQGAIDDLRRRTQAGDLGS